jgi:aspartate carbamoyltransferase catalytic subunit
MKPMPDTSLKMEKETGSGVLAAVIKEHKEGAALWHARRHLLDTKDLSKQEINSLLALSKTCKQIMRDAPQAVLSKEKVANLFFENSTRTRSSFELAAKQLGAQVLNLDIEASSTAKGETALDTARTMESMGIDTLIIRHKSSGVPAQLAEALGPQMHILNAGDGWNAHPTQALLDLFTMMEIKPDLASCKLAIVGDINHSRVARSNIWLLQKLGVDIHVVGPPTLLPAKLSQTGVKVHTRLEPAIKDADFVMALRLQMERQKQGLLPSIGEYKKLYRLDHARLQSAKPSVRVLHPGPINRGVEITDELANDERLSLVSTQVENGVAVRMAVLYLLLSGGNNK